MTVRRLATFVQPGSLQWLVANDTRNNWRMLGDVLTNWPVPLRIAIAIGIAIMLHLGAWGIFVLADRTGVEAGDMPAATIALTAALLWMVSQGLLGATRALYQRGELELLLTSPIAPWKAVAARAVSIAASTLGSLASFFVPAANVGAWLQGPRWLAIYPIAVALALAGTAIGFLIAVALFNTAGPRRARLVAQLSAAVIAGAFVLGVQLVAILPPDMSNGLMSALAMLSRLLPDVGLATAASLIVSGDAYYVAGLVVSSAILFLLSLVLASPAFVTAATIAAGASDPVGSGTSRPFREGPFAALRIKETRLLVRDPNLFAQLGLQIVYTLPLAVILIKNPTNIPPAVAILPLVVVLASQVSASLSWLTISGEDAPELIATAPLANGRPELAKLAAIAAPLLLILTTPVVALVSVAPEALPYAIVFGALAAASTALLNFWHPMPGNRRGMLRRHHQAKLIALAEHGLTVLWAIAAVITLTAGWPAIVPLALVAGLLWAFKPKSRRPHRPDPN